MKNILWTIFFAAFVNTMQGTQLELLFKAVDEADLTALKEELPNAPFSTIFETKEYKTSVFQAKIPPRYISGVNGDMIDMHQLLNRTDQDKEVIILGFEHSKYTLYDYAVMLYNRGHQENGSNDSQIKFRQKSIIDFLEKWVSEHRAALVDHAIQANPHIKSYEELFQVTTPDELFQARPDSMVLLSAIDSGDVGFLTFYKNNHFDRWTEIPYNQLPDCHPRVTAFLLEWGSEYLGKHTELTNSFFF